MGSGSRREQDETRLNPASGGYGTPRVCRGEVLDVGALPGLAVAVEAILG